MRARSVTPFRSPAPELIHGLKYQGWISLAAFMGERMVRLARLEDWGGLPGVVVPVPTTSRRLRERGFNPARLLAEAVSRGLDLPVADGLSRPREGPSQVGLPPSERTANVRGAFVPNGALSGALIHQHVLLVDDVLTTGATGAEAARAAGECGARTVSLVTFARALPQDPDSGGHPF
ncbi:MAG TPA: phosphoribosyltransferase family protein [Longimicrobiales bacterium]|nr:phosphoribosyltransferase family protein [Longimicrobiales bacterium]